MSRMFTLIGLLVVDEARQSLSMLHEYTAMTFLEGITVNLNNPRLNKMEKINEYARKPNAGFRLFKSLFSRLRSIQTLSHLHLKLGFQRVKANRERNTLRIGVRKVEKKGEERRKEEEGSEEKELGRCSSVFLYLDLLERKTRIIIN
ncbi:hypothetical protein Tco_0149175 [Tanacetum coccineum]